MIFHKLEELLKMDDWDHTVMRKVNKQVKTWLQMRNEYVPTLSVPDTFKVLRENKTLILDEYLSFLDRIKVGLPRYAEIDDIQAEVTDFNEIAWRVLHLRLFGKDTDIIKDFPCTMGVIEATGENCSTVMFSVMEPGKIIPPHAGFYCGILRYHLGLIVPSGCSLTINGFNLTWAPDLLFDDTFTHSVENPSDQPRIVLFLDVVRDMKDEKMNAYNCRILEKTNASSIVEIDVSRVNKHFQIDGTQ